MECILGRYDWCTPRSRHVLSRMRRRSWVRLAIRLRPHTVLERATPCCKKKRSLTISTHMFSAQFPIIHDRTRIASSTLLRLAKLLRTHHQSISCQMCSTANFDELDYMDLVTIKKNWNYILLYPFLRMMAEGAIEGSWALSLYFQLIILR